MLFSQKWESTMTQKVKFSTSDNCVREINFLMRWLECLILKLYIVEIFITLFGFVLLWQIWSLKNLSSCWFNHDLKWFLTWYTKYRIQYRLLTKRYTCILVLNEVKIRYSADTVYQFNPKCLCIITPFTTSDT